MHIGCIHHCRSAFLLVFGPCDDSTAFFWTLRRHQHPPYLTNHPPYPCTSCFRLILHTSPSRTTTTCSPTPTGSHWKMHSFGVFLSQFSLPKKEIQRFLALLKVQSVPASSPAARPFSTPLVFLPAHHFSLFSVLDLWLWGALIFVSGLPVPARTSL